MRTLVLGASGMLGNAMLRVMARADELEEVWGTARTGRVLGNFDAPLAKRIVTGVDVDNTDSLMRLFTELRPKVVINCIGLVKQLAEAEDPLLALPINSLLPHRLARLCELIHARLVHISTDCVFSGAKGGYCESDDADAKDLYGRSKFLGEVDYPHAVTLRTSIIGHELSSSHGLVGWFLAQKGSIKGYKQAIFSGLPTCELAGVIRGLVLPRPELHGVYHVAADPISKFELLRLVNKEYTKSLQIEPDEELKINRSLNATRFREVTGYVAPPWPQLIADMHSFHRSQNNVPR